MTADRLQIAARIHFLLRKALGEGIDVERMLHNERYARDVLLVCDAIAHDELPGLATAFRAAPAGRHVRGEALVTGWGADSTGFGGLAATSPRPATPGQTQPGWLESTFRWIGI